MLGRPTLGACIIAKNEEQNIGRCLSSIKGLVDEIYVTDTGSTDKTVEIAKNYGAHISHFEWVNDFAKARNFNLKQAKTDYVLWIDCDDVMQNPENFKLWRDSTMAGFDYWIATYHYASDPATDRPVVSFARERVINRLKGMEWKYFIHEGIMPFGTNGQVRVGLVHSWQIKHMRTINDLEKDKGRNIRIFEAHKDELDSRMLFYFGKEKFEAGDHAGATELLGKAVVQKDLEGHDRILAQQYLCYSLMMTGKLHEAIQVAQTGLLLAPHRAEFWVVIGDCYAKQNRLA
jgi:glycosyltransferase involved in cell wall biosynthesis